MVKNNDHLFHCKSYVKQCLKCNKTHSIIAQSTYKLFVTNEKNHYMTEKFADKFVVKGINNRYKHDTFFDTWCYDYSAFQNWMYTIKEDDFKVYMGYLFTKYECE